MIAALSLAPVHRLVRTYQNLAGFFVSPVGNGNAAGYGAPQFIKANEPQLFNGSAKAFCKLPGTVLVALRQEHGKLLATDSPQRVARTQFIFDAVGSLPQDKVTNVVPVMIIHSLEPVKIEEYDRIAGAVPFQPLKLPGQHLGEATPIGCTCEIVSG